MRLLFQYVGDFYGVVVVIENISANVDGFFGFTNGFQHALEISFAVDQEIDGALRLFTATDLVEVFFPLLQIHRVGVRDLRNGLALKCWKLHGAECGAAEQAGRRH